MSEINYTYLSDDEKLDLLRLLYHDAKELGNTVQKNLIVSETQKVYDRIKKRSH